jgi:DNA transposition AAA+ family ATPase
MNDITKFPYLQDFIITKEYLRFEEFAHNCAKYRYVGVCHGNPGVGKTLAAQYYSQWEPFSYMYAKKFTETTTEEEASGSELYNFCRAVYYSASISSTPKAILTNLIARLRQYQYFYEQEKNTDKLQKHCPLIILDEADRLSFNALEQVRDIYDVHDIGLILIGMPGIEKRLSRYPQLYSRIGFSHPFRPLCNEEMKLLFKQQSINLFKDSPAKCYIDEQAMATIIRSTGGNFRLINRLCSQVERILQINHLTVVTTQIVEAARCFLLVGE